MSELRAALEQLVDESWDDQCPTRSQGFVPRQRDWLDLHRVEPKDRGLAHFGHIVEVGLRRARSQARHCDPGPRQFGLQPLAQKSDICLRRIVDGGIRPGWNEAVEATFRIWPRRLATIPGTNNRVSSVRARTFT